MMIPLGEWLTIVIYRDFFDIPRLILVVDKAGKYWILDSKFDSDMDDYSLEYAIYFAGEHLQEAQSAFKNYAEASVTSKEMVARVPVKLVEFDQTRRHQLLLRSYEEGVG